MMRNGDVMRETREPGETCTRIRAQRFILKKRWTKYYIIDTKRWLFYSKYHIWSYTLWSVHKNGVHWVLCGFWGNNDPLLLILEWEGTPFCSLCNSQIKLNVPQPLFINISKRLWGKRATLQQISEIIYTILNKTSYDNFIPLKWKYNTCISYYLLIIQNDCEGKELHYNIQVK